MSLYDFYIRNRLPVPKPEDIGGIRIRRPPRHQGSNPPQLWKLLNHDPDVLDPFDQGDPKAQAETRELKIQRIEPLIKVAIHESTVRAAKKAARGVPMPDIFEIAEQALREAQTTSSDRGDDQPERKDDIQPEREEE